MFTPLSRISPPSSPANDSATCWLRRTSSASYAISATSPGVSARSTAKRPSSAAARRVTPHEPHRGCQQPSK